MLVSNNKLATILSSKKSLNLDWTCCSYNLLTTCIGDIKGWWRCARNAHSVSLCIFCVCIVNYLIWRVNIYWALISVGCSEGSHICLYTASWWRVKKCSFSDVSDRFMSMFHRVLFCALTLLIEWKLEHPVGNTLLELYLEVFFGGPGPFRLRSGSRREGQLNKNW